MKVLHAHSGNLFGGVETLLLTLGREMPVDTEFESHFALCFEGDLSERLRATGAPVYNVGEVRFSRPWSVTRARRRLKSLIVEHQFDIVICHSLWPQAVFGPAIPAGIPSVFWLHDVAPNRGWLRQLAKRSEPDFVVCNSEFTAGTLAGLYPSVAHEVIRYPITLLEGDRRRERVEELRQELATPEDAVVIVQVSRMENWKGQRNLLEALSRLKDQPNWICWQIGGAQRAEERVYMESLERFAREKGIADRVRFAGHRSDVPDLLAAADIHCQANNGAEPFGIVFIEALHNRLPVVTYAMGGAAEIVEPTCGIAVTPGEIDELSSALAELLGDRDRRLQLGAAGPARARELCEPAQQIHRLGEVLSGVHPS